MNAELLAALVEMEREKSDYMLRNHLGNPAQEHTNKMARAAIAKAVAALSTAGAQRREPPEKIAYIDGLDWQHHVEHDAFGVRVYPSVRAVLAKEACANECGVVRVAMRELDWPVTQALTGLGTAGVQRRASEQDETTSAKEQR